jgi:DNA repair exonuclease SbcCD ATPase subunit
MDKEERLELKKQIETAKKSLRTARKHYFEALESEDEEAIKKAEATEKRCHSRLKNLRKEYREAQPEWVNKSIRYGIVGTTVAVTIGAVYWLYQKFNGDAEELLENDSV